MHYSSGLQGGILGGLIGAFAGLGMCMWVLPDDWSLFPGDTILLRVVLCGSLGLIYGEAFVEWLKRHWDWIW